MTFSPATYTNVNPNPIGRFTIHAPPTSIPWEAYFPNFGSTTISKMADAASEFRGMRVDQLKKYLTDQLIVLLWSTRMTFCSFKRETALESCNLRCNNDGYFVTMYVWRAWNQNLLTHLPECSALSRLSHLNRMRAHGLWNGHKWSTIALVNWWEDGWIEG